MDDTYRYHRICSVIENIVKMGGADRNIILYPFGYNGFLFKSILNERYGYREKLLVDNKLSNKNPDVISMDNLCPQDINRTTWLVFTLEDQSKWEEIYNDIPNFVPREKIIFLFEEIHKHNKRNSVPQVQDCTSTDLYYRGCMVGRHTSGYREFITLPGLCERIGRFCAISRTARIVGNHPTNMVFVSSLFYAPPESESTAKLEGADDSLFARRSLLCHQYGQQKYNPNFPFSLGSLLSKNTPCAIGNDVWIGHNVTIMPGTDVGDGAVLAAGAVVTHDVPPYTIVAGVPAKKIRTRFSNDMINELLKIKWWEWSDEKIMDNYELFYSPKAFVEKFG